MYQLCSKESCCVFKNVSKSLMKVRHNMWLEDENESFNVEFIWNNNVIKWLSVSVENYKIMFMVSAK